MLLSSACFAPRVVDLDMAERMAKGGDKSRNGEDGGGNVADAGAAKLQPKGDGLEVAAHSCAQARDRLRRLYEGRTKRAHRFRYGLLIFDIVTLVFVVATSFMERNLWIEVADVAFGLLILADFCARLLICDKPLREFLHPFELRRLRRAARKPQSSGWSRDQSRKRRRFMHASVPDEYNCARIGNRDSKVAFRLGNLFQRRRHRRVDHHIGSVVRSSALLVQRLIQERTRWQSTNQSASALSQAQPANACRSRRR